MILISACSVYFKDTKMTLCNRKVFIITIVFVVVTGLTNNPETERFKHYENVFDFAVGLKNESDTILDYATKIQALFCPGQPICTAEGDRNSTGGLKTLPEMIGLGTEVSRIEDVHKIVGTCCLPCSCDPRSCKENGNCCMSKIFLDALETNPDLDDQNVLSVFGTLDDVSKLEDENETTLYSECIKASWLSYRDKDVFEIANDLTIPSYFMITRCFENNANPEDVTKCQSPSDYDNKSMLPVSSLATGRIYWNSHCARCNNDDRNIALWTASVKFDIDIAYFVNSTQMHAYSGFLYPETYHGILDFISKIGNILYIPPFPQEENMCFRKNTLMTCNGFKFDTKPTSSWLQRACERIYSPLVIEGRFGGRYPFLNIFCYLCRRQYFQPSTSGQCGYAGRHAKGVFEGMAALFDYRESDSSDNAMTIAPRQGKCRCDEIFDPHIVST